MTGSAMKCNEVSGPLYCVASRREVLLIGEGFGEGRVKNRPWPEAGGFFLRSCWESFSFSVFCSVFEGPWRAFWAPMAQFGAHLGAFLVTVG